MVIANGTRKNMSGIKRGFWGNVGMALAIAAIIFASFAIDYLLRFLSEVPVIGSLARWILHMRNTVWP